MMRLIRAIAFASVMVLLAVPVQAQAPVPLTNLLFSGTYTGGSNFETTASIQLSYDWLSEGVALFQLWAENLDTNGAFFNAVGLINLPSGSLATAVDAPDDWTFETSQNLGGDGLPDLTVQYNADNPVPQGDTSNPWAGTFWFQIDGGQALVDNIGSTGAGIHLIGYNDCSTKLGVIDGEVVRTGPYDPACAPTVVPEPGTIFLLGTGLAGLGVVVWRRREEDE